MTQRLPASPAPGPLEADAQHFDARFATPHQHNGFRRYREGLVLPSERNQTLTARPISVPSSRLSSSGRDSARRRPGRGQPAHASGSTGSAPIPS